MKKTGKIISVVGISVMGAFLIALTCTALAFKDVLNQWAVTTKLDVSDQEVADLMENGVALSEKIEKEGIVLAENKNDVLPLSKTASKKVNVFGWGSTEWVYCGSGSGRVVSLKKDFLAALNDYGIETNDGLSDMYKDFLGSRPLYNNSVGTLNSYDYDFSVLYEPNIDNAAFYSPSLLDDAKAFSDTAIVVINRVAGESNDSPKEQYYSNTKGGSSKKTDSSRTYLDPSEDEEELLDYVSSNYDKTVVIVNSPSMMSLRFLADYPKIDACLVVGTTGESAASAIPGVLYGDVCPSGRLTDTYPYDLKSLSTYADAGPDGKSGRWGRYTNGSGCYPADGTNNGNVGNSSAVYAGVSYVDYSEGIYVGYKWFETADAEGYYSSISNDYGSGYDGIVQYPFGYGLSYTTFDQKVASLSLPRGSSVGKGDTITVSVNVKNTGNMAGQDVVELYLKRPYTKGGIEKPEVELVGFGKTLSLAPGENENVEMAVKVSDFASYDCDDKNGNGFKGYEIEPGDYVLEVKKNAHSSIDDSSGAIAYRVDGDIQIDTDPNSGNAVKNRFDENSHDGIAIDGSNTDQNITYLSRADFKGTFPSENTANRSMDALLKSQNLYNSKMANEAIDDEAGDVTFGAGGKLKVYENGETSDLGYELGQNYDDAKWDGLLDQVSLAEAKSATLHGYVHNEAIDSIGKPKTNEVDGPAQIGSFNVSKNGVGYPNATVIAQTWNKELAYKFGLQVGKETSYCGYDGWYAPGCNLHRSPFCGRNFEYYSEDPLLSGMMAANTIGGAKNIGIYVYLKHFICYEQETFRDGLYTWLTEQDLRENYLKPFQLAIEVGGCTGIMTSYNRLGGTWASGSVDLIRGVLFAEWDYRGAVITDYADHQTYMNMDQALRAGTSLYMDGFLNNGSYQYETSSNTFKQDLREAVKRDVYAYLNAKYQAKYYYENGDDKFTPAHTAEVFPYWVAILVGVDCTLFLGMAALAYFAFFRKKRMKKGPANA